MSAASMPQASRYFRLIRIPTVGEPAPSVQTLVPSSCHQLAPLYTRPRVSAGKKYSHSEIISLPNNPQIYDIFCLEIGYLCKVTGLTRWGFGGGLPPPRSLIFARVGRQSRPTRAKEKDSWRGTGYPLGVGTRPSKPPGRTPTA